jgi:hypothetical protein
MSGMVKFTNGRKVVIIRWRTSVDPDSPKHPGLLINSIFTQPCLIMIKRIIDLHVFIYATVAFFTILPACKKDNDPNTELINQIRSITYITEHYPPLNYEQEGELHGVSVDILEALFGKMNVNLSRKDIILKNWSDAYQQTLNEEHTMLFSKQTSGAGINVQMGGAYCS